MEEFCAFFFVSLSLESFSFFVRSSFDFGLSKSLIRSLSAVSSSCSSFSSFCWFSSCVDPLNVTMDASSSVSLSLSPSAVPSLGVFFFSLFFLFSCLCCGDGAGKMKPLISNTVCSYS